eukprot:1156421-Pelagomonas_calceolata.AAC.14
MVFSWWDPGMSDDAHCARGLFSFRCCLPSCIDRHLELLIWRREDDKIVIDVASWAYEDEMGCCVVSCRTEYWLQAC